MSVLVAPNIWRHHEPVAVKLNYGCPPNTLVFVNMHPYLIQGGSPEDPVVLAEKHKQMGYQCHFIIDLEPENGKVEMDYDGQAFFYMPDKDFIGVDFVSYRIINCMGQSSEPKCVTFNVDSRFSVPQLIKEDIIKLDTVILHNGNSDVFNINFDTNNEAIDRFIYAFNLLPSSYYALAIAGFWGKRDRIWYEYFGCGCNPWNPNHGYKVRHVELGFVNSVYKLLTIYQTSVDSELEIITIKEPVGIDSLGVPEYCMGNSPQYKDYHFCYLNFVLTPVGNARTYAKTSNKLFYSFYNGTDLTNAGQPFPEENPTVSPDLLALIAKTNVVIPTITEDQRHKPLLTLNGLDVVAFKRPTYTRMFKLDSAKIGKSLGLLDYPVYSLDCFSPSHQTFIEVLPYIDPSYVPDPNPNPIDPDATPDPIDPDPTTPLDQGPILIKRPVIDPSIPQFEATIFRLCVALTNIPPGLNLAVTLHVLSPSAVVQSEGVVHQFLAKDDSGYSTSTTYNGFIIIDTINCNNSGTDLLTYSKEYKLTANLEYLCLPKAQRDPDVLAIDLSYVLGVVVVPCSPLPNTNAITSNYIPIKQNNEVYEYKDLSEALYNPIYLGSTDTPPMFWMLPEQQFYRKTLIQTPDCLLYLSRYNTFPYTVEFNLFDLTNLDPNGLDLATILYRVQHPEWGVDPTNNPLYIDAQGVRICLEEHYGLEQHISNDAADKFPEIVSLHNPASIEGSLVEGAPLSYRYAVTLTYKANGSTESAKNVNVKLFDSQTNHIIYKRIIYFDTTDDTQQLLLGILSYDLVSGFAFRELLSVI